MKRTTKLAAALLAAFVLTPAVGADAAKPAAAASAPAVVNGVTLAKLCDTCGVVTAVNRETRKGKASGVGAVGGAVAGGVVGRQTTDSTAGTVGGAAIGGIIGHQIEKQVKKRKVWATTVTMKDGSVKKFDAEADPGWKAGAVVQVAADGQLVAYKR
jgi:outer membrane lipoprotein SlyB